jgi:putative glycosyltransferase (TIGR04372 family)
MFLALQEGAGRRIRMDYGSSPRSPNLENHLQAQSLLAAGGLNVVDLWAATGNPASLIGDQDDMGARASDELQTWLFSNCELFLSGASGSWWIAWALSRPTLTTDSYAINFDVPLSMQLPKLLWDRTERRMLTISEIGPHPFDHFTNNRPGRYEVISNTPEEIAEAVIELRAITRGEVEVDSELQARVSQLAHSSFPPGKPAKPMPLMGQGFLRRHPEILA